MNITEITPNTGITIVIDLEGYASFFTKDELNLLIKDGSIQPGFHVIQADVHAVYKAAHSVELFNIHVK